MTPRGMATRGMATKRTNLALWLTLVAIAATVGAAAAQEEIGRVAARTGQLTETELWEEPAGETGASREMDVGDPVRLQTRLETGRRSRAQLLFDQGAVVDMLQRDRITIQRRPPEEGEGALTRILQGIGTSRVYLASTARDSFEVTTRDANLGPKGTALIVRVNRTRTVVWVLEGVVEVLAVAGGPPVLVEAGELTVVRRGQRPTPPTPFDPKTGATASGATPAPIDRPPEELLDPPLFPVPEDLPPQRGIDDQPGSKGGPPP